VLPAIDLLINEAQNVRLCRSASVMRIGSGGDAALARMPRTSLDPDRAATYSQLKRRIASRDVAAPHTIRTMR
jgi:hypothetical protein